jgi:transcription termination/antitermination protein NusG
MTKEWYVIRVASNREERVRENLLLSIKRQEMEEKIDEVLVPTETVTEIKRGKRKLVHKKIFPGYIMIHADMDEETWFLVRETPGIGDFVGSYRVPQPMAPHEVDTILNGMKETEEKPQLKIEYNAGDRVKIKEGAFANFNGVVDEVNPAKGLVRVIVMIFGRETPVELEYWQVEPV